MKTLEFNGSGAEYFKIWIVNILLVLVTFGFYYPWAKVRNKRYFYANTCLEGRYFDYHATGKQLFFGYLIAMTLLIAYLVLEQVYPIGSVVMILLFFIATPWVMWRSMKFNLSMTSFSNVRFSFDGLLGGAYINYMLLPAVLFLSIYGVPILLAILLSMVDSPLTWLTILIAFLGVIVTVCLAIYLSALILKRNTAYAINSYRFGQGSLATNVETKEFSFIVLKTVGIGFLLGVASMVIITVLSVLLVGSQAILDLFNGLDDPEMLSSAFGMLSMILAPTYLMLIGSSLFLFAYFYAKKRAYVYANSTLDGNTRFSSTLRPGAYALVTLTNFFAVIFSLGLATPWAKVRVMRLILENTHVDTDSGFDEYITAKQEEQSSLGEQIGDAFDVDVEFGI